MNTRTIQMAALAAVLTVTAACSGRRPEQLPPDPPGSNGQNGAGQNGGMDQGGVNGAVVPGSAADFLQSVPSDRVFFDTDSYQLTAEGQAVLDQQAQWLQRYPNTRITIEGHCDERGTREYNLALGERRANSVRIYLEGRGISSARMTTISWGMERPVAEGANESAWAQNRRAVTVLPN